MGETSDTGTIHETVCQNIGILLTNANSDTCIYIYTEGILLYSLSVMGFSTMQLAAVFSVSWKDIL